MPRIPALRIPAALARRSPAARLVVSAALLLLAALPPARAAGADGRVELGRGALYTRPRGGATGIDVEPPRAAFRTGEALRVAAPTNQWYSSLMFRRWSRPLYAQPLTFQAGPDGFEIGLPERRVVVRDDGTREVRFLHAPAVVVVPAAFAPRDARLAGFSDWLARLRLAADRHRALEVTVLHGSPFAYFDLSEGDARLHLQGAVRRLWDPGAPGRDPRVAAFTVAGRPYAVYAPAGARIDWEAADALTLHLRAGARYFAVAGLPDASDATIADFLAHAYAFPTATRASFAYDAATSTVTTRFQVATAAREGANRTTFMGLYPHHWAAAGQPVARHRYESVRGPIRVLATNEFTVTYRYHGLVPAWGGLEDPAHRAELMPLLDADIAGTTPGPVAGRGPYWTGKQLGALVQLAAVAAAEGRAEGRALLLVRARALIEDWFDGRHAGYFLEDRGLGTVVGIPQEYNSVQNMNDHHFQYGYWLGAAAHLALDDPAWAAPAAWGGMVGKLVADIATDERGRTDFPYLRHFDPYEGHSWASGTANLTAGNNQESSSEAVNAWASLALLGAATGDARLRDLGICLYTTEIAAIDQYWFDLDHVVLPAEFGAPFASLVFGGQYAYGTWWTAEPRQIAGINVLPVTPASTYLGRDPALVRRIVGALPGQRRAYDARGLSDGTPPDIWQDVLASFLALADAGAARAQWRPAGPVEAGETRAHTLYWLLSLAEMGRPDFEVSADAPLYQVFRDAAGRRTYLAYNPGREPLSVRFSDGHVLEVAPHALARGH